MFSNFNGKLLIEYIAEKGQLTKEIIQSVKNQVEIVDIIISYNENLGYLRPEILQKLLIKDENGLYPIEKYLIEGTLDFQFIEMIDDGKKFLEICTKYNNIEWLRLANKKALMSKINGKRTLLEILIYEKRIWPYEIEYMGDDIEFINFIRKNDLYILLTEAKEKVLLLKVKYNNTLLEELIELGYTPKLFSIANEKTLEILHKNKLLKLVNYVDNEEMLLKPAKNILNDNSLNNQTLLEYMLDNGYNPLSNYHSIESEEIINIYLKCGYYQFLGQVVPEHFLLIEVEDGVTLLDQLLEKNVDLDFGGMNFRLSEIAKKLYNKNRLDLLSKGDISVLLQIANDKETYFDIILEAIKEQKIKNNLNEIHIDLCSNNEIATFYLLIAKHDMIEYVNGLTQKQLLKKQQGKTLLDELLDLNAELTINKILPDSIKSTIEIAVILKSRGLEQKQIDVPLKKIEFTNNYLDEIEENMEMQPVEPEGELLLQKLYELFINDGKSDKSLVLALVAAYRDALVVNYPVNIRELRTLVKIKERNINSFAYIKEESDRSYFSHSDESVHCNNTSSSSILHETGHALHYYLSRMKSLDKYETIIERVRLNPETIKKVESFSNRFYEIKNNISKIAEEKYSEFFDLYYNNEKIKEIEEFINQTKETKKEELKSLGIPDETLEIILDDSFTIEQYIEHQKRIFINQYVNAILRSEFPAFRAIGDILDAIYKGEFFSNILVNEKGKIIKATSGHGIAYYSNQDQGFKEMIANFAVIVKSKNAPEMLDLLRSIIGEELYNLLSDFYYENIVDPKSTKTQNIKNL